MPDGHFPDAELLRRELAALILEWAGKAVKDDPDGPLSTALTRAVSEAARSAVADQHQILGADAADQIAEALERRGNAGSVFIWRASPWGLGLAAVAAAALLSIAFVLGLQAGRNEATLPAAPTTAAAAATPIAPIAPAVDETAPPASPPSAAPPPTAARPQRAERQPDKPPSRPPTREVGRPAPASEPASPRSTQPVGAPPPTTLAPTTATTP